MSIRESIRDANTLTEPVYNQAMSLAPISTVAVVTEAVAASLRRCALLGSCWEVTRLL